MEKAGGASTSFTSKLEKSEVKKFLNKNLPVSDKAEIEEQLEKPFILFKTKRKQNEQNKSLSNPRKSKKNLTLSERRQLGLYKLPKRGLKYENYLKLHELWKKYMISYLELKNTNASRDFGEAFSMLLYKADYHGAIVTIKRSKCPNLVGLKGIVLMDTKNTFKIISEDNILRVVPKEVCMFSIKIADLEFTLFGKRLLIKPIERSSKKCKNRKVIDL